MNRQGQGEAGESCRCTESSSDARGWGAIPGRRLAWQRLPRASFAARNILSRVAPAAALARIGRALHGGAGRGDEQLVALVGAGDERAFEEIVDRYGAGLLSFCVHMLRSREWGEDALQLTLTSAYQALSRGRRPDALRPWLYTIARNRCLSELRSVREYPRSDAIVVERPELDGPPSLVARREQLRELVEDIQRLPDNQRAALVLFELGDYSHAEIASVLDVRCENVKALIFQAREGLMRGRTARESPCSEVRERMASARGKIPARGQVRAHIDRCAPCRAYEHEVRRQRSALALIIPIAFSGKLRASVLASAAHGSAGAAGVAGAGGGTAAAAGAGTGTAGFAGVSAVGSVSATGAVAVSGPGAVAGAAGGVSVTAAGMSAAAGGAGAAASGAGAAGVSAPAVFASALGGEAVVGTLGSSASTALVAKIATAAVAVVAAASAPKVPTSLSPPSRFVAASMTAPQPASNPAPAATAPSTGASQPAGSASGGATPLNSSSTSTTPTSAASSASQPSSTLPAAGEQLAAPQQPVAAVPSGGASGSSTSTGQGPASGSSAATQTPTAAPAAAPPSGAGSTTAAPPAAPDSAAASQAVSGATGAVSSPAPSTVATSGAGNVADGGTSTAGTSDTSDASAIATTSTPGAAQNASSPADSADAGASDPAASGQAQASAEGTSSAPSAPDSNAASASTPPLQPPEVPPIGPAPDTAAPAQTPTPA